MRARFILNIVEKLIGKREKDADMYMPERMLAIALVMLVFGIAATVFAFVSNIYLLIAAAFGYLMFVYALLCWKNWKIIITGDDTFEYTTFLGNTRKYNFSDITTLRKNSDSMTLYVGDKKIHIEAMAVLNDRLIEKVNEALSK